MSCKIDESITLCYNAILYDELKCCESIFIFLFLQPFFRRKMFSISLVFVHYKVIKLRYVWWYYSWNSFSLVDGLWRLVCLFMVYCIATPSSTSRIYIFWWDMIINKSLYYCHIVHQSISSEELFFFRVFYLSTRFLSFLMPASSVIFNLFPSFWLFLFFMLWMLATANEAGYVPMCHMHLKYQLKEHFLDSLF